MDDRSLSESGTESAVFRLGEGSISSSVDGEEEGDHNHSGVGTAEPQTLPPLQASFPDDTGGENGRSGQISL